MHTNSNKSMMIKSCCINVNCLVPWLAFFLSLQISNPSHIYQEKQLGKTFTTNPTEFIVKTLTKFPRKRSSGFVRNFYYYKKNPSSCSRWTFGIPCDNYSFFRVCGISNILFFAFQISSSTVIPLFLRRTIDKPIRVFITYIWRALLNKVDWFSSYSFKITFFAL